MSVLLSLPSPSSDPRDLGHNATIWSALAEAQNPRVAAQVVRRYDERRLRREDRVLYAQAALQAVVRQLTSSEKPEDE